MEKIGKVVLAVLVLVGIIAIAMRFSQGLIITNMTQNVPWGFWVALYIYFIGLSAGSFLISSLVYVFGVKRLEAAGRMALLQAFLCMVLALWLIFIDLGHPERFFKIFTSFNPSSILAWEAMLYIFYTLIILGEMYFAMAPQLLKKNMPNAKKWLFRLGLIGIPVAIGVHGGTGAIFAVAKARPSWFSGLYPIIFLVSALASGGGLLTFLMSLTSRLQPQEKTDLVKALARLTVGFICLDWLLFCSEILVTFYGNIPHEMAGWRLTLFGPYWWVFWFIQLGIGAVVPVIILLNKGTRDSVKYLRFAGLCVVVGIVGTRLNIVIAPLATPIFECLPDVYHHSRFAFGYFPSINEWLVGIGSIAIGALAFMVAKKSLPQ